LSLTVETSIGKKFAIYLPKAIVKALNLKEGGRVLLRVSGTSLVLESTQDPPSASLLLEEVRVDRPGRDRETKSSRAGEDD
jgi:AbrB family looped-hinge helix DNA binding protein